MANRFQSPLSNLCDVLSQIKDAASQYQATLKKNEASTRAVLIDPVLRALGWDTANTHMVEIEKSQDSVRADYALNDSNSVPKIIVEAKALGANLSQQQLIMSLVNYAFQFQLNDVFLTDGLVWHHYNNFQPGNVTPTRVLDIVNGDPVEIAAYLVHQLDAAKYWPVENIDALTQRIEQLESTVATLHRMLSLQQPSTAVPTTSTVQPGANTSVATMSNQAISGSSNTKYVELNKLSGITGRRPASLQLPDGSTIPVSRWKDVLRECCKFVLTNNSTIPLPFPDRAGKKVSLFSTTRPPAGISYATEQYNGQTLFIYLNYDANNCVANAEYVLQSAANSHAKTRAAVAVV